jgi:NAD(P)H dehydrogenase (quinone)
MAEILVLYYSQSGSVAQLANHIARGVESVAGMTARVRTVPKVSTVIDATAPEIPAAGPPYVEAADLVECVGLALGSPTRFGNMAAPVKYWLDGLGGEWMRGTLTDKPASVFTASSSAHGGNEATLLSMIVPLLHHGMVIVGVPYSTVPVLSTTTSGGTPYGASHVSGGGGKSGGKNANLTEDEKTIAFAQGKRLAEMAKALQTGATK